MKKVYLIRHGLPDFPGGERMCLGSTDIPMGEAGLQQAQKMAAQLPPVSAVFSSPLIRAVQTAEVISLPLTILDDLRELDAGQWDGLTFTQIRQQFPQLYAARAQDLTLPLPDAEDHAAGLARFTAAMHAAAQQAEGDFAVVAHGGVIAQFMQAVCGVWQKPEYCQILCLTYQNGTFALQEEKNHA